MRALVAVSVIFILFGCTVNDQQTGDFLVTLKNEIKKKDHYDQQKERRISQLKRQLDALQECDYPEQYLLCDRLYKEYKDFVFDSAHTYTKKLILLSSKMNDRSKYDESKIKLGTIQLSWGMFKETFDELREIDVNLLPDSIKLRYYELKSRTYTNLALYNTDEFYSPVNQMESIKALKSAFLLTRSGSYERLKYTASLLQTENQNKKAESYYRQVINNPKFSYHQRAMAAHDLSNLSEPTAQIKLITLAAIYDIRSSTKETLAMFTLGRIFFEQGKLSDAELLLNEAAAQANFYGNKLHSVEISATLTLVAGKKLSRLLTQMIFLLILAIIGTGALFVIVYRRLKEVRLREIIVKERNEHLDKINKKLSEDASIKEAYIGYFFKVISAYILKLEPIKRQTERGVKMKNEKELLQIASDIDIKRERNTLFFTFDSIFLKLFPNFINAFNSLLRPEDQIWPKRHEVLNTNLRIFALMRLGIKDNKTIAAILENTISTIYTYKVRIKAKALIPADEFEKTIMEINFVESAEYDSSL